MSEETKATDPAATGTSTSEFKFAAAVAVAAGLIGGIESAVLIAKEAFPHAWWVPLLSGLVGMLGAAMAYMKSRSTVKAAIINSGTQFAISQGVKPVVTDATVVTQNPLQRP